MEASAEKAKQPQPDKEGLSYAVGRILGEGYALTHAEITRLGKQHYGVSPGATMNLMHSSLFRKVMEEIGGVSPTRRDYKANKVYVDGTREPIPGELNRTYKRIDKMRKRACGSRTTKRPV